MGIKGCLPWLALATYTAFGAELIAQGDGPAQFDSIWVRVLRGLTTECKSCPSPLCSNTDFYGPSLQFMAICWAGGAPVNDTK
jgi:hypothetical protein